MNFWIWPINNPMAYLWLLITHRVFMRPRRKKYDQFCKFRRESIKISSILCTYVWLVRNGSRYELFRSKKTQKSGPSRKGKKRSLLLSIYSIISLFALCCAVLCVLCKLCVIRGAWGLVWFVFVVHSVLCDVCAIFQLYYKSWKTN